MLIIKLILILLIINVNIIYGIPSIQHKNSLRRVLHQLKREIGVGVIHNGTIPLPGHIYRENPPVDSSTNRPPPPPIAPPPPNNVELNTVSALQTPKMLSPFTAPKYYEIIKAANNDNNHKPQLEYYLKNMTTILKKHVHVHIAIIGNPLKHFGFIPSNQSISETDWGNTTTYHCVEESPIITSNINHCIYATNGGFFDMKTGQCIGSIAHNGKLLQLDEHHIGASFGITKRGSLVTGYLSGPQIIGLEGGFEELLTGRGWLIRNSQNYLQTSIEHEKLEENFVTEEAPRTGIAFDKLGRILLIQIDGEEDTKKGCNLYEFTNIMEQLNVLSAINLDGGGSSVSIANGKVISRPTCDDTKRICVRDITTITCVY